MLLKHGIHTLLAYHVLTFIPNLACLRRAYMSSSHELSSADVAVAHRLSIPPTGDTSVL